MDYRSDDSSSSEEEDVAIPLHHKALYHNAHTFGCNTSTSVDLGDGKTVDVSGYTVYYPSRGNKTQSQYYAHYWAETGTPGRYICRCYKPFTHSVCNASIARGSSASNFVKHLAAQHPWVLAREDIAAKRLHPLTLKADPLLPDKKGKVSLMFVTLIMPSLTYLASRSLCRFQSPSSHARPRPLPVP